MEAAKTHLGAIHELTTFALHAPIADFPAAFDAIAKATTLDTDRANQVLAHAFTLRATRAAIDYHARLSPDSAAQFRPGFFTALASLDPALARVELLKIPPGLARHAATRVVILALTPKYPTAAIDVIRETEFTEDQVILTVFGQLAQQDPVRALSVTGDMPKGLRESVRNRTLTTWLLSNPNAGIGWINQNIPASDRPKVIEMACNQIGYENFAALYTLETHPDPTIQAAASKAIDARISSQPAPVIWDRILSSGWKGIRLATDSSTISSALSLDRLLKHAATAPEEQIKAVFRSLPSESLGGSYSAEQLLSFWAFHDPVGALAWAKKIPTPDVRHHALLHVGPLLADIDPALAIAQIESTPPSPHRTELLRGTVRVLAQKDLPGTLAWIAAFPPSPELTQSMDGLADIAAAFDPDGMRTLLKSLPPGPFHDQIAEGFIPRWAAYDVPAALDWFSHLPRDTPLRDGLRSSLISAAVSYAPELAIAHTQALPPSAERIAFIQTLAQAQITHQPEAVFALIDTLPAGQTRTSTLNSAIAALARDDPVATADLLMRGSFGPPTPAAVSDIVRAWSGQSIGECARWLESTLAKPDGRTLVGDNLAQVARSYARSDPDAALAWVERIPDKALRAHSFFALIEGLAEFYPGRARKLVEGHDLPHSTKTYLLDHISRQ